MSNFSYDYIICGAGLAGLMLAFQLSDRLPGKSILLIDPQKTTLGHKTFSFWVCDTEKFDFDEVVYRNWKQLKYKSQALEVDKELNNYTYKTIRGADLESYINEQLSKNPHIARIVGTVTNTYSIENHIEVKVKAEGQEAIKTLTACGGFNSIYSPEQIRLEKRGSHNLKQYFAGWEIRTEKPVFDTHEMTMFDFKNSADDGWNFFYTLPFESNRALIENVSLKNSSKTKLKEYIEQTLGLRNYEVTYEEYGSSPMTDYVFPQKSCDDRVVNIGTSGGMIKPSSGYSFMRVYEQSKEIADQLAKVDDITKLRLHTSNWFFRKCDSLLLHSMEFHQNEVEKIFNELFQNTPADLIMKFLDERTGLVEKGHIGLCLLRVMKIFAKNQVEDFFGARK